VLNCTLLHIQRKMASQLINIVNEIRRQLAANPSLVGEEARDGDVYSGLFPKERSGRWRGLGLLVGGRASMELAEVKAELQESKNENLRL